MQQTVSPTTLEFLTWIAHRPRTYAEAMDAWRTLPVFMAARERTASDDIARIARRHFIAENRTIGIVRRPDAPPRMDDGGGR